jgi:hypothetical protein
MRVCDTALGILVLTACLTGCGGPKPVAVTWTELKASDGSFSVLMPATPVQKREEYNSPGGKIVTESFSAVIGPAVFSVTYFEYEDQFVQQLGSALLANAGEGGPRSGKTMLSQTPTTVSGYSGTDYRAVEQFGQPPRQLEGRLIQVRNRIYDVLVEAPAGTVRPEDITKFVTSFKLLAP